VTPFQVVITIAYLGGIGLLLTAGYRLIVRFARPEATSTPTPIPQRKDAGTRASRSAEDSP
jgi:hypothetical protein